MVSSSRAIVVVGPWPGKTVVSPGRGDDVVGHGPHQRAVVSARQVGPADRTCEQLIATEQRALGLEEETAVPRCVAGCVKHPHLEAGEVEHLAMGKRLVPLRWRKIPWRDHPEHAAELILWRPCQPVVVRVQVGGEGEPGGSRPGAADVVDMAVGGQQRDGDDVVALHEGRQPFDVRRGVDQQRRLTPVCGQRHIHWWLRPIVPLHRSASAAG